MCFSGLKNITFIRTYKTISVPNKIRIDKWLWAIRIYKTRSKATSACKAGRVKIDGKSVKASYMLEVGTEVHVGKKEKDWIVVAEQLIEKRVSAALAVTCYEDKSPPEPPRNYIPQFFYKTNEVRKKGEGRPTKKERRLIDRYKDVDGSEET